MAQKQSLANKRRSLKNRNKSHNNKRARTIRSMRQVNRGGMFSSRAKVRNSSLSTPLLSKLIETEKQGVDDLPMTQRYGRQKGQPIGKQISKQIVELIGRLTTRQKGEPILQPLMTKSPREKTLSEILSTKLVENFNDITENEIFDLYENNNTLLENFLRIILYNITDNTAHPGIHEYIYDTKNREDVIQPIIGAINFYLKEISSKHLNTKRNENFVNDYKEIEKAYSYDLTKLKQFALQYQPEDRDNIFMVGLMIYADIKSQNDRLLFDFITNSNQLHINKWHYLIMAIFYTLKSIFIFDAKLQEPWINVQRANIYEKYEESKQSKGGSKGKMSRPKTRTRKL